MSILFFIHFCVQRTVLVLINPKTCCGVPPILPLPLYQYKRDPMKNVPAETGKKKAIWHAGCLPFI